MRALWYGAIALSYAGYVDEARRRALEAFEQAAIHEINHMAGAAAYEIAFIEFARGDVSEAKRWVAEAIRWGRKTPVAFGLTAALMMNVSIALASGDYVDAQRVMVELEQERVVHSYARARAWLLGFRLTLAWKIQGRSPSPLEIRELLEQFEVARQFVGIDFVALMVHDLLCAAGRSDEGRRVLEEYITVHRRDRSPLPSALRSAMSRQ
jgi:ATP/maltotriose-dependent transcriptional regulator MalT